MPVRFGVIVPQELRLDLVEIEDPVEQFDAMTAVAREVDRDPAWDSTGAMTKPGLRPFPHYVQ